MPVLRQQGYLAQPGVQAIRKREVHNSKDSTERYRGLRAKRS